MLLEQISILTGIPAKRLKWIAYTSDKRYKTYEIPKKSNRGTRTIHHPSRTLKAIQTLLNYTLWSRFPVHERATAYTPGSKISKNAQMHKDYKYTIRLDFKDFFPSFKPRHIRKFLESKSHDQKLTDDDIKFVIGICSKSNGLTIGAPCSPTITNALMYPFDIKANEILSREKLTYTRYADDIYISSNNIKKIEFAKDTIRAISLQFPYAELEINELKTLHMSKKNRRSITGVIITPNSEISIGRDRKRLINAMVHHYVNNKLDGAEIKKLQGTLAFAQDCEPTFLSKLRSKYGDKAIESIFRNRPYQ